MGKVFKPTFLSIVIAVLNSHKALIRQARHFKKMNLPDDVEIIIVDDGSNPPLTFSTGVNNFYIYYTNDKRPWTQGLARNMGAKLAQGKWLLFTDIDHIVSLEAINAVREFKGDRMVFPRYYGILDRFGDLLTDVPTLLKDGLDPQRLRGHRGLCAGFHPTTYAIRKSMFIDLDGFDPDLCQTCFHMGGAHYSEDRDFNRKYARFVRTGRAQPDEIGPAIHMFPIGKFRADGNTNPHGLFHGLSYEQVPQPRLA